MGCFDPLSPFVVTFIKKGLCYKMVIWLTPPPPQLTTWFMDDPLGLNGLQRALAIEAGHDLHRIKLGQDNL